MKTHGHYTAPGPPLPQLSFNARLILTLVTLAIVGAGLLALIYRFSAAPELAPTAAPVSAPAAVVPAGPIAANQAFADEILAARQVAPAEFVAVTVAAPGGPVVYRLPERTPALWLTCQACADEALGALRMPAPERAAAAPAAYVVRWTPPDTRAVCAVDCTFADEILASATYDHSAAMAYAAAAEAALATQGAR